MKKIAFLALAATGLMGNDCGVVKTKNACEEYVDYLCDCGDADECLEASNIYDEPTSEDLETCSQNLDEKQYEDANAGIDCEVEDEDSGI